MTALEALFAPRRVAVLGASRNPAKLGHVLLDNVLRGGFPGESIVRAATGTDGGQGTAARTAPINPRAKLSPVALTRDRNFRPLD